MLDSKPSPTKKIRKGDKVIVMTGDYKGRVGLVQSCHGDKVIVQGVNMRKKHIKKSEQAPQGGIVEYEKPVHVSNVRVCDGDNNIPVKLKVRKDAQGDRQFVYQNGDETVVYRSVKNPK